MKLFRFFLFFGFLFWTACSFASEGKIVLKSGHSFKGDIQRLPDGGFWVVGKRGSAVKYDLDEIESYVIYSDKDAATEKFNKAFSKTPKQSIPYSLRSRTKYDKIIEKEARNNSLDPALVKAVIKAESNFNPNDTSHEGACGLMQLMPKTAKLVGVRNIYDPKENIRGGTRYLRDMLYTFNGDREKAIAAYNAGPFAVKKYNAVPPYFETKSYVMNVNHYYRYYKKPSMILTTVDEYGCLKIYNSD